MHTETIPPPPHSVGAGGAPALPVTPPLNPLDHLLDPSSSNFSDSESDHDGAQAQTDEAKATIKAEQIVPEQRHSIIKEPAVIRYYLDPTRNPALIVGGPGACDGQAGAKSISSEEKQLERTEAEHLDVSLLLDVTNGCGGKIWPAAQVLGAYLTGRRAGLAARWKGKKVIELGSGTGLVGFVLAKMRIGAHVWVTDQDAMLGLMRQNLALNSNMDPCDVEELDWGEPIPGTVPSKPDVLLLADCVYLESAFQPLVDTMVDLSTRETEILFCYQKRRKADKRFFTLLKRHFTFEEVSDDDPARTREYTRQGTRLYVVRRR